MEIFQNEALWFGAPGIMLTGVLVWKSPEILRELRLLLREWRREVKK